MELMRNVNPELGSAQLLMSAGPGLTRSGPLVFQAAARQLLIGHYHPASLVHQAVYALLHLHGHLGVL